MRGKHPSKDNIWNASIHKGGLDMWSCGSGQSLSTNSREANWISIKGHRWTHLLYEWGDTSGWFLGSLKKKKTQLFFMYLKYIKAFQDHLCTLNSGVGPPYPLMSYPLIQEDFLQDFAVCLWAFLPIQPEEHLWGRHWCWGAWFTISTPVHPKGGWWGWVQVWVQGRLSSSTPKSCNHAFLYVAFTKLEP